MSYIKVIFLPKISCIVFLFACISFSSFAQKVTKIEILKANSLEFDQSMGKGAKRLIGDVSFKHDNAIMNCDSAYLYSETNTVKAYGHIYLNQADSIKIYGDSLNYNGDTKKATLLGNVKMIDKEMTLTSNHLDYDLKKNTAYYTGGGKIISSKNNNTLTSKLGYYYANNKTLFFKNDVLLNNPEVEIKTDTLKFNTISEVAYFHGPTDIKGKKDFIYCENGWYNTKKDIAQFQKNAYLISDNKKLLGDSLYYDRISGFGKAIRNVQIIDTVDNVIINGDYAIHNEKTNNSTVTGNMFLTLIMDGDSLFLHGDTLKAIESDNKNKSIYAYNNVRFYKKDLSGSCDSLVYNMTDSLIKMYVNPILWSDQNQMTADSISIKIYDGKVDKLFLNSAAFIVAKDDSLKYNQIKGKTMVANFVKNKLNKVYVTGNGQTLYYAKEDNGGYFGVNKAESSDLIIYIKENAVDKLTFINKPDAILNPLDEVKNEEAFLKDFRWLEDLKPKSKEDIFTSPQPLSQGEGL